MRASYTIAVFLCLKPDIHSDETTLGVSVRIKGGAVIAFKERVKTALGHRRTRTRRELRLKPLTAVRLCAGGLAGKLTRIHPPGSTHRIDLKELPELCVAQRC